MYISSNSLYDRDLYIPSTLEGLDMCLFIIKEVGVLFSLNLKTMLSLHTIVLEAVENAFIHGNLGIRDKIVRFSIKINQNQILIEVEDEGNGFDIDSIPSPITSANLRCESGRGIFFIKSLSDSCCTLGKGNIIQIKVNR
jgi:serine/threonine-protein kinase RsbW